MQKAIDNKTLTLRAPVSDDNLEIFSNPRKLRKSRKRIGKYMYFVIKQFKLSDYCLRS